MIIPENCDSHHRFRRENDCADLAVAGWVKLVLARTDALYKRCHDILTVNGGLCPDSRWPIVSVCKENANVLMLIHSGLEQNDA